MIITTRTDSTTLEPIPYMPTAQPRQRTSIIRPRTGLDGLFGFWWPDPRPTVRHPRLVAAAVGVGLLAAMLPLEIDLGLGWTLVALAALVVVGILPGQHRARLDRQLLVLCGLLVLTGVITAAAWAVVLCWGAAAGVLLIMITRTRTISGMLLAGVAASLTWLRGLPWLARSVTPRSWDGDRTRRMSVSVVIATTLVVIFGALFVSADGLLAAWVESVGAGLETLPARIVIGVLITGLVLGGVVLAVLPPELTRRSGRRRVVGRYEWVVPVASVAAVFGVFLLAQASALFGGAAHLQATTGLTYAAYVHQGFGQLIVASALVVVVIGVTVRIAPRSTVVDRRLVQGLLGLLCVLALAVAGSGLYRLALYDSAYGASRLRLLVAGFEVWVVIVLVLAGTVCLRLRGDWVPRVAVVVGAIILLTLTMIGPDRVVAERNVARFESTGQLDWSYLGSLTADAVPALDRLPEPFRSCALAEIDLGDPGLAGLNLGTTRARALLAEHPIDTSVSCAGLPSR